MRGRHEEQEVMLAYVNLEERVPKDHPLRAIKAVADEALGRLSPEFDRMYSKVGRASVPPERVLKASLLISLYSLRSERAFCEELEYNLLFQPVSELCFEGVQRETSLWQGAWGMFPQLQNLPRAGGWD